MHQRKKRLFDHVVLHVKDLDQSKKFYRAIAETLGHTITREGQEHFFIDELEVRQNSETTKSIQLAFHAENPGSVNLFHETALRFGGKCLGSPKECLEPGIYTAHVQDPDGNYVKAIFKGVQRTLSISY